MDGNKLKVLRQLGYRLLRTCGECTHSQFFQDEWGTCAVNSYQHAKHTGEPRQLSIHQSGTCPKFERWSTAHLRHYAEFIDDPE